MSRERYTTIPSCYCGTTVRMPIVTLRLGAGLIFTAMSKVPITKSCVIYVLATKKVFIHEHDLFTIPELRRHEKFGDDNPGAIDQSGFKGHPECGFCRQRFYGDDELYTHCRDKHERCHLCDRRNGGRQQQYYVDYNSLEQHFRKDHFACIDQECLEKKFVVFDSEMVLKAHQLQAHPNGLSKDARRDARLVDISGFDYRVPYHESRGGRRDRQGGRGRDPNTEALPQSTAQPLRRDELAYQRQMAIQSAQSVAPRTFGGQLTSTTAVAARPNHRQDPETVTATRNHTNTNPSFPAIDHLNLNPSDSPSEPPSSPSPAHALTLQEQARRLHHTSVMDRASALLKHDSAKLSTFRTAVSAYQSSNVSATQLIDNFFSLFFPADSPPFVSSSPACCRLSSTIGVDGCVAAPLAHGLALALFLEQSSHLTLPRVKPAISVLGLAAAGNAGNASLAEDEPLVCAVGTLRAGAAAEVGRGADEPDDAHGVGPTFPGPA